jgi:hypothetical protein
MRFKMKSGIMLILLAILVGFPAVSTAGLFKVVRVFDGDTINAVGYDIEIKVRLWALMPRRLRKGNANPVSRSAGRLKNILRLWF